MMKEMEKGGYEGKEEKLREEAIKTAWLRHGTS